MRLAYLGPAGTFSEEAALRYSSSFQLLPFASIPAVAVAVETGMADEGIVPIENSLEGSVSATLDLLIHDSNLLIRQELVLPIEHCLLAKPGTQAHDIRAIISHPQALAQCRHFIDSCFPKAEVIAALSTAAAVEEVLTRDLVAAAIGPIRAAELYGAEVLARGIQDQSTNFTRFIVLGFSDHEPTGNDKTSLSFTFSEDRPGLLVEVLREFAERRINLNKVESRPLRQELWRYYFLVDLEGHRQDPQVAEALERVAAKTAMFKIFGSYPKYQSIE